MTIAGFLNAFLLKTIMLALMLLDHIHYFILPRELYFAHVLSRVVAPVFAFFIAQGMVYTRSRERYIIRIFAFGAIMAIGNMFVETITKISIPNNIFLPLGIGAAIIYLADKIKEDATRPLFAALIASLAILSFYCEGQYLVPMSVVIFYFFRQDKTVMYVVYVLCSGLPFLVSAAITGELPTQFYMIFAVIPIMLYNGKRGPDNFFAKYLFYGFYPLHIWLLASAAAVAAAANRR